MANSKIVLTYFDLDGRAEIIRLVLVYAGKEFEDNRIAREDWPEIKPTSPFGQLPFVEIDGKKYGQSLAIASYFAKEFNLFGKTNLDGLKIDQIAQLGEDFIQEVVKAFREQDPDKKAEITKKVLDEVAPRFFGFYENLLKQNNGKNFVGDSVSLADLIIYDFATGFCATYAKDAVAKLPLLSVLVEKIGSNEKIKAYKDSLKK